MANLIALSKELYKYLFSPYHELFSDENLEPTFFAQAPKKIKYASSIQQLSNYLEIPTDEFPENFGLQWTESLLVCAKYKDRVWLDKQYSKRAWNIVDKRFHHPLTNLVLCKINDSIGHGIFLAPDAELLPKGTVIGIYSGHLTDNIPYEPDYYTMQYRKDDYYKSILKNIFNHTYVTALKQGNLTRFILDFPDNDEIQNSQLAASVRSCIAAANVELYPSTHYGFPLSILVTARDIVAGEPLGFSYKGSFWENFPLKRCVFNKKCEVIGYFKDHQIIIDSEVSSDTPINTNQWLENSAEDLYFINSTFDSFDPERKTSSSIDLALEVFKNRFKPSCKQSKYINKLQALVKSSNNPDKNFSILYKEIHKKESQKILNSKYLLPLKMELNHYLNKYYETKIKLANEAKLQTETLI